MLQLYEHWNTIQNQLHSQCRYYPKNKKFNINHKSGLHCRVKIVCDKGKQRLIILTVACITNETIFLAIIYKLFMLWAHIYRILHYVFFFLFHYVSLFACVFSYNLGAYVLVHSDFKMRINLILTWGKFYFCLYVQFP